MTLTHFERYHKKVNLTGGKIRVPTEPAFFMDPKQAAIDISRMTHSVIAACMDESEETFSYGELAKSKLYSGLLTYLERLTLDAMQIYTMAVVNYHVEAHRLAGKRVYQVSDDLADKLAHTEVRGVLADDLRLPYENVYLMVPEAAGLKLFSPFVGWIPVTGIYVTEDPTVGQGWDGRGWRLLVHGATDEVLDLPMVYFRIPLIDGRKLTEMIEMTNEDQRSTMDKDFAEGWETFGREWEKVFRWVMNAMLYATWEEAGEHWESNANARKLWDRIEKLPKKSKKRARLRQRLRETTSHRRIRLGYKTIDRSKPKPMSEEPSGPGLVEGMEDGKRRLRIRVAGHWRKQAHGPKHSLRRYQWIEPHWRNKDGEEEAPRRVKLDHTG